MNHVKYVFIVKNPAYLRNRRIYNKCEVIAKSLICDRMEDFAEILKCDLANLVKTAIAIDKKEYWAVWNVETLNQFKDVAIADFYNGECKKYIAGNAIICGKDGENCKSLTNEDIKKIKGCYRNGYVVCNIDAQTHYIAYMEGKDNEKG